MNNNQLIRLLLLALPFVLIPQPVDADEHLKINKGDHVSIIGSGLAERMNHFGYFETLLHDRFPEKNLVVRNIGYAGDVVDESKNLRIKNYGSRDRWLKKLETDVLLVMYGFNESFRGPDKLKSFRQTLNRFVKRTKNKQYNGERPPRIALVSPIAHEDLDDPALPDGTRHNRNLKKYTNVIKKVAEKNNLPFVNLFSATRKRYREHDPPWTLNGVHLIKRGYRRMAPVLDRQLFGTRSDPVNWDNLNKLRTAVQDKNTHWFRRYRVNDGYNVYGGRSHLSYDPNNMSNREVYRREMKILEQMTANRDKKVWALAQEKDHTVKDDNLPDNIEVETNAPGDGPNGAHTFLGGKEAIDKMDVHPDLEVNLFASEEMFPELINPVQMSFDTQGRLWVAAWEGYPNYKPPGNMKDELIILEDTDGDGTADERTIFADGLSNPTGFEFWNGGVLVAQMPYLLFLKDTDGDDRADVKRRLLSHLSAGDSHHSANSFIFGAGGNLYFQEGVFHRSQIETPRGVV